MDVQIRELNRASLRGFAPYLLPETQSAWNDRDWVAVGAVTGTHSCGAAAACFRGQTAVLTDLFVDAAIRRNGVAAQLLTALLDRLAAAGVRRVEADYVLREPELSAMDALLVGMDFSEPTRRSTVFQTDAAQFHGDRWLGRAFEPGYRTPAGIVSFAELMPSSLAELETAPDVPPYLAWHTLKDRAEPALSTALVSDGVVTAYLLAAESADGGCTLLAAVRRENGSPMAFPALLTELVNRAYYRFGGAFPFYFSALTPRVEQLARRLLGDRFVSYEEHCCTLE